MTHPGMGRTTWPPSCNPINFSLCMLRFQVCVLTPSADISKNMCNREDVNQVPEDPASLLPEVLSKLGLESNRDTLEPSCPKCSSRNKDTCLPKALAWLAGAAPAPVTRCQGGFHPRYDLQLDSFSTFWILLRVFFLLGLFPGQCSPDI